MFIYDALITFANWIWGLPMLIWLVGGGIILTIAVDGIQFRKFGHIMRNTLGTAFTKESKEGEISGFQAVTAALAATLGTGNIIGVGVGIAMGGPGALFWMWMIGFVAMAIKYSEIVASMKFREKRPDGEYKAGPYMYISKGFKNKTLAKVLAVLWVISMVLGILLAASVHTGAIVDTLETAKIPRIASTIIAMAFVMIIVYGGVHRLVSITERMVPVMSVLYILGATAVMFLNAGNILPSIKAIFQYAFKPAAPIGAFTGSLLANTIRWGIARGMYSSDSGNGIASIMHGQASADHPVEQGIWGVFEVFFDTIIVCSFTGFAILTSGVWSEYPSDAGATLAVHAFTNTLGPIGSVIIVLATVLFAITTVVSFAYFIESQMSSILGKKVGKFFQGLFIFLMYIGGTVGVTKLLFLTDVGNAVSILINMSALLVLSKVLRQETRDYFKNFVPTLQAYDTEDSEKEKQIG